MDDSTDTLATQATQEGMLKLARAKVINARALERALEILGIAPGATQWNRFLNTGLLALGAAFLITGVFFFFAYNWADMHRFVKLGIVEGLIITAVAYISYKSLDTLTGKITLTVLALLVGALLSVFGQIYQTGADSWRGYVLCSVLIAGWVWVSKFSPLWFIWVLLLNLCLFLYWGQVVDYRDPIYDSLFLWLFLFNGLAVLAWEVGSAKGLTWLANRWTPRLLSLLAFYALLVPTLDVINGYGETPSLFYFMAGLFFVINALVIYFYSARKLDLFMLTASAASLMFVLNAQVFNWFENAGDFFILFMGIFIIGQTALVVTLLRRASNAWEQEQK